jgi:hypothetical protein
MGGAAGCAGLVEVHSDYQERICGRYFRAVTCPYARVVLLYCIAQAALAELLFT